MCGTFVSSMFRSSKVPSSGGAYVNVAKKSYWVMSDMCINEVSFLKFIGLY